MAVHMQPFDNIRGSRLLEIVFLCQDFIGVPVDKFPSLGAALASVSSASCANEVSRDVPLELMVAPYYFHETGNPRNGTDT
ncbi:hypothetical protein ZOD2009_09915 [Haladaptatus paucihalophilus DX253]|uniref:Uncharacterized protein n=1 Tax=Haladaptatus paucihalophilus DX253 TaxID=797209 RepID=E7QSX5_HALPU|nr:hypothetical protein ZOD2009_09915 [Haladaptatus paucihalophilus DX253]